MDTVYSADGTAIAYDRAGHGPALILVGGAFQHRVIDPRTTELAELLAADFTVFNYDRRGRGDSGAGPGGAGPGGAGPGGAGPGGAGPGAGPAARAVAREIEDLEAVVKQAGGPAFVFGNSSGALLALDAAVAGLAVTRLAVYEAPVAVDQSRPPVPAGYLARLTELASAGRRGDAVELFLTQGVGLPEEMVAGMRHAPVWPAFEAVAHTLPYDAALAAGSLTGQPLPAGRCAPVTSPVLVIDGGASPEWMRTGAAALAAVLPAARRQTLEGQDHAVDPGRLAPVLREFFTG